MGNWDLVITYDAQAAEWLASQGFAHPAVMVGNRMPTIAEIRRVLHDDLQIELAPGDRPRLEDGSDRIVEPFRMRGAYEAEVHALFALSQHCGQLWLYPDTGAPSLVIAPAMDPDHTARVYREAHERAHRAYLDGRDDDGWRWLHEQLYAV